MVGLSGEMDIEWNKEGTVGSTENLQICTKECSWWIVLDNGQEAEVAQSRVIINPFPRKGQSHISAVYFEPLTPGVASKRELKNYGLACYEAGVWAEKFPS